MTKNEAALRQRMIANDNVGVLGLDGVGQSMVDMAAQGMEGAQSTIEGSARPVESRRDTQR